MSWAGCEETTWWLTWALRQEDTRERVSGALNARKPVGLIIEELVSGLDERIAMQVRSELEQLPSATVLGIIEAWNLAQIAGKPFELASVRPQSALDLARRRSVRLSVDVHEDGVRAELSHIPTRHPSWQLTAPEVAAASAAN